MVAVLKTLNRFASAGLDPGASPTVRTAKLVEFLVKVICVFLLCVIGVWGIGKMRLNAANCAALDVIYDEAPPIASVNPSGAQGGFLLRDYYVKTAYNCCAGGAFKNDFVNVCALRKCIAQGARCLDFAVYDVRGKPVVAVSTLDSDNIKECYNSVPFEEAMTTVANHAFSSATTACSADPMILHFRIMSMHKEIYDQMAETLYRTLEKRMLGNKYSYENWGHNFGAVELCKMMGKIVIIVDKSKGILTETSLDEYTNVCSNSMMMRSHRYTDIRLTHDPHELTEYNKQHMTIVLPDLGTTPDNPSAPLAMNYGCQFVAMCFQNFDSNMEYSALFFDKAGSAFSLKPTELRFVPQTIDVPAPPPANYSYATRMTEVVTGQKFPT